MNVTPKTKVKDTPATTLEALTAGLVSLCWPRAYIRGDDSCLDLSTRPPGRGLWCCCCDDQGQPEMLTLHLPSEWVDPPAAVSIHCMPGGALGPCLLWRHAIEEGDDTTDLAELPAWPGFRVAQGLAELLG